MLEKNEQRALISVELTVILAAEKDNWPDFQTELKIETPVLPDLPRAVPDSMNLSFESDWAPVEGNVMGRFAEWYPNGLTWRNVRIVFSADDAHTYDVTKKELVVAKYFVDIEADVEYMWDDDLDYHEQGHYWNVEVPIFEGLEFSFGTLDVFEAGARMLDYQQI